MNDSQYQPLQITKTKDDDSNCLGRNNPAFVLALVEKDLNYVQLISNNSSIFLIVNIV